MNLDLRQGQAERAKGVKFDMPVFYYTQLMGLAFGLPADMLRLEKLAVSPEALLKKLADRRAEKARAAVAAAAESKQAPAEPTANPAESHEAEGAAS